MPIEQKGLLRKSVSLQMNQLMKNPVHMYVIYLNSIGLSWSSSLINAIDFLWSRKAIFVSS